MGVFSIEDLTFTYPKTDHCALQNVSLNVEPGEYIVVCGKSGCGKTTLLRHLKTVLAPFGDIQGSVLFNNSPLAEVSVREQSSKIGFVMQNPDAQVVTDKVWHELAFGLESLGYDQQTMRLRVAEMASYFGIQHWFHRDVRSLSGGQKQLLNLASIMAMQPEVLILDEPTSQLDPLAASDFLNTVHKINRELGTTIILTEHRLEDVFAVADRVVVMESGSVIADDEPRKVSEVLHAKNDDMLSALPAPSRIYYGLADATQNASALNGTQIPLTVREGRNWLSAVACGVPAQKLEQANNLVAREEASLSDYEIADPVIELKDVWFRYEKETPDVLKDVNLKIPAGGIFTIMGGNGAGKSTLIKSMCGAVHPYRGTVRISGKKLKAWKAKELFGGHIAMLPQDPQNLFVKKTVFEDLKEMAPAGISKDETEELILEISDKVGIKHLLQSHPFDLSGGEIQRAALAKILLTDPQILLLDEPTKGIDGFFKAELADLLRKLTQEGRTVVMVSHDIEFCAKYSDIVSMMFDGSVVSSATPQRFFSHNSFYTTAANRMSRHILPEAVTEGDVVSACATLVQ